MIKVFVLVAVLVEDAVDVPVKIVVENAVVLGLAVVEDAVKGDDGLKVGLLREAFVVVNVELLVAVDVEVSVSARGRDGA